jgi:hypothetical protein
MAEKRPTQTSATRGDLELRRKTDDYVYEHWDLIVKEDPRKLHPKTAVKFAARDRELLERYELAENIFFGLHKLDPRVIVATSHQLKKSFNALDLITSVGGQRWFTHHAFKGKVEEHQTPNRQRVINDLMKFTNWELGDHESGDNSDPNPINVLASFRLFLRSRVGSENWKSVSEFLMHRDSAAVVMVRAFPTTSLDILHKAKRERVEFWEPVARLMRRIRPIITANRDLREPIAYLLANGSSKDADRLRKTIEEGGKHSNILGDIDFFRAYLVSAENHPVQVDAELVEPGTATADFCNHDCCDLTEEELALVRLFDKSLLSIYFDSPDPIFQSILSKLGSRPPALLSSLLPKPPGVWQYFDMKGRELGPRWNNAVGGGPEILPQGREETCVPPRTPALALLTPLVAAVLPSALSQAHRMQLQAAIEAEQATPSQDWHDKNEFVTQVELLLQQFSLRLQTPDGRRYGVRLSPGRSGKGYIQLVGGMAGEKQTAKFYEEVLSVVDVPRNYIGARKKSSPKPE